MIVSCPYCSTRYELDVARITNSNPMLKCSRCRHIFPAPSSKKQPTTIPRAAQKTPADEESLTLPFEEPVWKDEEEAPEHEIDQGDTEEAFTMGMEGATGEPVGDHALAHAAAPTRTAVTGTVRDRNDAAAGAEEDDVEDEDDAVEEEVPRSALPRRSRRPPRRPPSSGRSNLVALLIFFGLVVFAYGILTRALFASPALCDRLIGQLPLIGTIGDDQLLVRKVALSEVVGGYQRIRDGKDVFVITGKAINTAPVALHGVQILGKLFNPAGDTLDTKTIYCGNVVSAKVLTDLTPAEVSILQKLSPPKKFVIEPGESSTFVVVFMDPPKQAAEFTAQVVGAQRQA